MLKVLLAISCLALLGACVIRIDSHENYQHLERTVDLPAAGLNNLIANTGAGNLIIIGEAGRTVIEVQASINYHNEEDIDLTLGRSGDSAVLEAGKRFNFYNDRPPVISLTVLVPASFDLNVDDGSGHLEISGVAGNMQIKDGSGHIDIRGGHNITVDDGSGHMKINRVTGNLDIKDGSGHIEVSDITGSVYIDDGSGDIDVDQAGAINIHESGSGKVRIRNVNVADRG